MLVKDLSILFQAGNEGVANVLGTLPVNNHIHLPHLENYFETSHVDAKEALNTFTSKRNSSLNISAWPRSFKAYLTFPCLTWSACAPGLFSSKTSQSLAVGSCVLSRCPSRISRRSNLRPKSNWILNHQNCLRTWYQAKHEWKEIRTRWGLFRNTRIGPIKH